MNLDKLMELFGLNRNFTKTQLEQAYRDLVQVWHPDRYSYNPRLQHKAEEKLKEINNAYGLLQEVLARSNTESEKEETSQRGAHSKYGETYYDNVKQQEVHHSCGCRRRCCRRRCSVSAYVYSDKCNGIEIWRCQP